MLSQGEKMVLVKALRSKMEKYGYVKSEGAHIPEPPRRDNGSIDYSCWADMLVKMNHPWCEVAKEVWTKTWDKAVAD